MGFYNGRSSFGKSVIEELLYMSKIELKTLMTIIPVEKVYRL